MAAFKKKGDWCKEHGLPESQCVPCNPQLATTGKPVDVKFDEQMRDIEKRQCEHRLPILDCDDCRYEVGVIKLDGDVADALVTPATAETRSLSRALRLTGEVLTDPTRSVSVSPLGDGIVVGIKVWLGQQVQSGDTLAVVRSSDFGQAKAAYIEARAETASATRAFQREKDLRKKNVSSEAEYMEAERAFLTAEARHSAAQKRLRLFGLSKQSIAKMAASDDSDAFADLAIKSPRAGTVMLQDLAEGQFVEATRTIYTIADLSQLWVWCDVYERDLAVIHNSLAANNTIAAKISVAAFPGTTFAGTVDLVGNEMDRTTRTVKARVRIVNKDGKLRPGMFARVELRIPVAINAVSVPDTAVLSDDGETFVFQHWKDEFWIRRDVTVGETADGMVEIERGIPSGTVVAANGGFMLKSDVLRNKMGAG